MSKPYRRFEMLLPCLFNDGTPVPEGLIVVTLIELEQKFGAVSSETQTIHGRWHHEGVAIGWSPESTIPGRFAAWRGPR